MLKVFGAVLALFSILTIIWSIAFYVATSLLNAFDVNVSPFVAFLISDMVGFVFIILIWTLIGILMSPNH
ncbi:two-component sensor histidine kinase, partial [Escherichia sp. HC-CC]